MIKSQWYPFYTPACLSFYKITNHSSTLQPPKPVLSYHDLPIHLHDLLVHLVYYFVLFLQWDRVFGLQVKKKVALIFIIPLLKTYLSAANHPQNKVNFSSTYFIFLKKSYLYLSSFS